MVTVDVGVRTDDDLVPVEVVQVKGAQVLDALVLDLHTAAQHAHKVHDDVGLKDARIVLLQAVENLAADGHNALELGIARGANGARCRVALYDIDLATALVLGAAVDEFLHAVGHIGLLLQVGLDALTRLLGVLARALVDEHLLHDLVGGVFVLDQVGREALLKEGGHGLLDKAVIDGLLGLVFVGRLSGEAVGHQHQAVLDVLPFNAALVFVVFALLLNVGIDGAGQSAAGCLFGRAAVLEPGGVVVVLLHREGAREAHARGDLYVVVGQVLAVATATVSLDKEGLGEIVGTDLLEHIVLDALGIAEVLFGELAIVALDAQAEGHVGVDHGLAAHGLAIPLVGNADRGKDLKIGTPLDGGAGAFLVAGLNLECLLFGADDLALLKV